MGEITIVRDGEARAAIFTVKNASAEEQFAAEELRDYLGKITGAQVPLVTSSSPSQRPAILVCTQEHLPGGPADASLGREGFLIQTAGGDLHLVGADPDGVLHAVYTFLERFCGVRWFWPGEEGEIIPQRPTIQIGDVYLREEPSFRWRRFGPGGPLWGPKDKWEKERELGVSEEHQRQVALWERRNRLGGLKVVDGHAWIQIIPPEKYGQEHPEYFALVNGRRDNVNHDGKHFNQLCTTNPELIETFATRVREYLDTHDVDVVSISPNDGLGFCECERCRALDTGDTIEIRGQQFPVITDRIFTFANEIGERIAQSHPDKYLLLLVYSLYIVPPKRVRLRDNIIAQFCMQSAIHWDRSLRERDYRRLEELAKRCKELGIYEYYINGSWPDLPRLFIPLIADSVRYCHELGFRYYSPQTGAGFAINGLNYYVAAKLLWDVETDVSALLEDFYATCFGPAAPMMRQYFGLMEEGWRKARSQPSFADPLDYKWLLETFSPSFLTECRDRLDAAWRVAHADDVRRRIGFVRKGFEYIELTMDAVAKAHALTERGVVLFPPEEARESWREVGRDSGMQKLLEETIAAWEKRARFIEESKQGYEISYLWVRYTDENRQFNPLKNLRVLQKEF